MGYFLDAIICGPAAVAEYISNEFYCLLADGINAIVEIEEKAEKKAAKETTKETVKEINNNFKAEIVEFKEIKDKVNSVINADFSTMDDDEINSKLTEDETSNYIEDIVEKVTAISDFDSDKEINDVKLTALAVLLAINKVKFTSKISTEFLKNRDDVVELNTIYRFFTNIKYFAKESSIQLNEVIRSQLLYDTVITIYNMEDFSKDEVMSSILAKAKKRLEKEAISNAALTDSDVDPVTPVVFDQYVLGSAFNGKTPKVTKTTQEYIIGLINSILPADWVRDNSITFEMAPRQDMVDPNKDTGMAILTVKLFGEIAKQFSVDLDNITGNGYSLGIPAYVQGYQQPVVLFVSIEKFPNIIKNAIMRNYYTLNNPSDPDSIREFESANLDAYGPQIYSAYDLSGMSKHLSFMTNEEKLRLGQNLMWISAANWSDLGLGAQQYRMRIRNYKTPDKFTLVSDKNTRQQLPDMLPVFGGRYKKYFKDPEEDIVDTNILVCKFDTDHIDVAVNGATINTINLPPREIKEEQTDK